MLGIQHGGKGPPLLTLYHMDYFPITAHSKLFYSSYTIMPDNSQNPMLFKCL